MAAQPSRARLPMDSVLFGATLALVVLGLWMVFDSSYAKNLDSLRMHNDAFHDLRKQLAGAVLGLGALLGMVRLGYWRLRGLARPLMIVGLLALAAVYVPHLGVRENNADRWLRIGPISFQASELAKLTLVIYLAKVLSRRHCDVKSFGVEGLAAPVTVIAAYLFLIEREPDLGTMVVLLLAVLCMLFAAGARKRHVAGILAACLLLVLIFGFAFGHRGNRITAFLHPDLYRRGIGFQPFQSKLAIGSGGLMGAGLGEGIGKYYLPQGNTDFIFATLAEELGFFRTTAVLFLLLAVGWRGFRIAQRTEDRFGALLATGIAALISWQAIVNVAVATGAIPATGVPLPFISYGSSSLLLLLMGVGILLSIARNPVPPLSARASRAAAT